jgi:hypothetical protein
LTLETLTGATTRTQLKSHGHRDREDSSSNVSFSTATAFCHDCAMRITRLYTGEDGQSHFDEVNIDLVDQGATGQISALWAGTGVMFRRVEADYDFDFHNAPRRQLVVNLDGWAEVETGGGDVRRFGPGSVMLAEDVDGQGHKSRAFDGKPRNCLFIPLDG